MKWLHYLSYGLLWIGGLNWGLVGLFNLDLVETIFGTSALAKLVYVLVGAAAVYTLATHKSTCSICIGMEKNEKEE